MATYNLEPIAGSAFVPIVEGVNWQDQTTPSHLRVVDNLGWLVGVNGDERIDSLVGFSIEAVGYHGVLLPPRDVAEVKGRLGRGSLSSFNTDMTAKGIGSTIANTPMALQPGSVRDAGVAVRSIPIGPETAFYMRSEDDAGLSPARLLARHLGLLLLSAATNAATLSTKGTDRAARYMERDYRGAKLVHMTAPPIWQIKQEMAGVVQDAPPQIMLVRGRQFAESSPMTRIGLYPLRKAA